MLFQAIWILCRLTVTSFQKFQTLSTLIEQTYKSQIQARFKNLFKQSLNLKQDIRIKKKFNLNFKQKNLNQNQDQE